MADDLWTLGACALRAGYAEGSLDPPAVMRACLARIARVQPALNAFTALRTQQQLLQEAEASAARWRAGQPLGALDGVPLAVKDNLPTADLPTSWGCAPGFRCERDELAVARARAAGAIVVGKTNVPEFTLEGYTSNRAFGTTRNPWNRELTPGGSSGGSVAAVAAGCVPLALGTDGGGSIRRPASHTNLVGLKPSIGMVPRVDALPPLLLDFEVVGPIARSVEDARLLFDALRGPDGRDRRSLAAAAARPEHPARPLRVLHVATLDGAPVDAQVRRCTAEAAARLAGMGHAVEEGALPLDLAALNRDWPRVGQIGLAWLFARHPHWHEAAGARYAALARQGAAQPASALWGLLEAVEQLRRDCTALFGRVDLVLTPAAAALPWPAEESFPPLIDGEPVGPRGHAVFTGWVNAAGLPALALPAGFSAEGLPIGIQLVAGYGRDDALFDLGQAWQAQAPEMAHRPAL